MSIKAYELVWKNSRQAAGVKLTLLALAEFCSAKNDLKCWPSIPTLADMVGCSDRQIKRNLAKLEDSGELEVLRNVGRSNTNLYDLSPLKGDTHDTIDDKEKVTPGAEKVTPMTIKGDTHDTRTVYEPEEPLYSGPEYIPASEDGADYQTKYEEMKSAICTVTKQPVWANNGKLDSLAVNLLGDGIKPGAVLTEYRPGGWWYEEDWRGKKGQRPTLKAIGETILEATDEETKQRIQKVEGGGYNV